MYDQDSTSHKSDWPAPLSDEAFPGLAGEIVHTITPHSEADPAALLLQLLVAYGNIIGHQAHYLLGSTRHTANLFAVLAGASSKARKGTSWDLIRALLRRVDANYTSKQIASGLSSGEGLIEKVRDAEEAESEGGALKPPDKRLLVMEGEFTAVLKMLAREGNILSAVLRNAWDGVELNTLTRKHSSLHASEAHISIVGHVTVSELRRHLSQTEMGNGFANRFLWMCVRRSKLLPDGGNLAAAEMQRLANLLRPAVDYGRRLRALKRDDNAHQFWHLIYRELSEGKPGLLGAITNRAEAQVLRLSLIFALLNRSPEISFEHLVAAQEVWRYAADSARFIFGDALGDPLADAIYELLLDNSEGLTRTEIYNFFGRNKRAEEISRALAVLKENNRVVSEQLAGTGGRPAEVWKALNA